MVRTRPERVYVLPPIPRQLQGSTSSTRRRRRGTLMVKSKKPDAKKAKKPPAAAGATSGSASTDAGATVPNEVDTTFGSGDETNPIIALFRGMAAGSLGDAELPFQALIDNYRRKALMAAGMATSEAERAYVTLVAACHLGVVPTLSHAEREWLSSWPSSTHNGPRVYLNQ